MMDAGERGANILARQYESVQSSGVRTLPTMPANIVVSLPGIFGDGGCFSGACRKKQSVPWLGRRTSLW